jgi:hypothetical protein
MQSDDRLEPIPQHAAPDGPTDARLMREARKAAKAFGRVYERRVDSPKGGVPH